MGPMADSSPPPKPSHQSSPSTEGPPSNGKIEEGVGRPGRIEVVIRRVDKFQQDHGILGFPFAVVQKFGNDQAGAKAALVAYYGLFALFPLLLVFTTILGYALHDNKKLQEDLINSALGNFPIIGPQLHSHTHALTGSVGGSGHREHSPRLWRSWARAGDPERDERRMEHSLRSLALDLPALPASAGGPRLCSHSPPLV